MLNSLMYECIPLLARPYTKQSPLAAGIVLLLPSSGWWVPNCGGVDRVEIDREEQEVMEPSSKAHHYSVNVRILFVVGIEIHYWPDKKME